MPGLNRQLILAGALTLLTASSAWAQARPRDVVTKIFEAIEAKRWTDVAPLVDSAGLAQYRREHLQRAWSIEQGQIPVAGPIDPKLPECVQEYVRSQSSAKPLVQVEDPMRTVFLLGFKSADQLEELSPRELFLRALEAQVSQFGNYRFPGIGSHQRREVIGEVVEADSIAYVLFRQRQYSGGRQVGPDMVGTMQLVRRGQDWKVTTPGHLVGFGSMGMTIFHAAPHGIGVGEGPPER